MACDGGAAGFKVGGLVAGRRWEVAGVAERGSRRCGRATGAGPWGWRLHAGSMGGFGGGLMFGGFGGEVTMDASWRGITK